jgi:hypothetical protein
MRTTPFRKHKVLKQWRNPEDEDRLWTRTNDDEGVLCLPPEYDWYLKNRGILYRVEKSPNNFSWCLYADDKENPVGWDQSGYYVKTLVLCRNGDRAEALRRARIHLPNESAFWVADEAKQERRPEDDAFDAWFNEIVKNVKTKKRKKLLCPYAIGMMTSMLLGGIANVRDCLNHPDKYILPDFSNLKHFIETLTERIKLSELSIIDHKEDSDVIVVSWFPVLEESLAEAKKIIVDARRFLMRFNQTVPNSSF